MGINKTISRWYGNWANERVEQRLRANDQRLGKNTLLVTMVGRKSGKLRKVPVNYKRVDGAFVIGTEASWWHNLKGGADVEVLVAGETFQGRAEPILDDPPRRERLGRALTGFSWLWFSKPLVVIEITVAG